MKSLRRITHMTRDKVLYAVFAVILAVLSGIMFYVTAVCCEDLWYQANSKGEWGTWEYFMTTLINCVDHWQWDTGRLCNTVSAPFLALLPKWIYAFLTAILIIFLYIVGILITRVNWISLGSAIWMFIISFVIPWHDFMFTVVYSINYIWGAFWGLLLFYIFINSRTDRDKGIMSYVGLFIISFVAGWWHEGLSAPLLVSLIVYQMGLYHRPSVSQIVILLGLAVGLVLIFSMPAFWMMTEERGSNIIKSVLWETLVHTLVYNCLAYIYILSFALVCCIGKWRRKIFISSDAKAFYLCILVFGLISSVVYFKYYNGPRTGMFSQLFCGMGIIAISKSLLRPVKKKLALVSLCCVFILAFTSLIKSIEVQKVLSKEIDTVKYLAAIEESRTGRKTVFYDPTPIRFGIDLLKPSYQILNTKYGLQGIELYPTALENFSLKSEDIIYCENSTLIIYNNRIIYTGPEPDSRVDVILKGTGGEEILSRTRFRELITADGDTVYYVIPHVQAMGSDIEIADVKIVE